MSIIEFLLSLLIISIYSYISDTLNKYKKKSIIFFFLFLVIFSFFIGLRVNGGHDYENYLYVFQHNISTDTFGINIINKLIYDINLDYSWVTFLFTFIAGFFVYINAYKNNTLFLSVIFSFLIGYIFFINNQIKQGIVASVFIYSLVYIYNRNFIKYYLLIIVSSITFHLSGLFLLLIYFIPKLKLNLFLVISSLSVAFLLVKFNLIHSIYVDLLKTMPLYGEIYSWRMEHSVQYINSGYYLIYHILLMSYIVYYKHLLNKYLLSITYIGTLLFILTINSDLLERFMFYLLYIKYIALIDIFLYVNKKNYLELFIFILVFLLMFINFFLELGLGWGKHGSNSFNWYFFY